MKRTTSLLLSLALLLIISGTALAETCFNAKGSALVPGVYALSNSSTYFHSYEVFVTNISNQAVDCRITVYDQDGNDVSSNCSLYTASGQSFSLISSGVNNFTLPARSTRLFQFFKTTMPLVIGYAVIEWASNDGQERAALIASVRTSGQSDNDSYFATQHLVNEGKPF